MAMGGGLRIRPQRCIDAKRREMISMVAHDAYTKKPCNLEEQVKHKGLMRERARENLGFSGVFVWLGARMYGGDWEHQ